MTYWIRDSRGIIIGYVYTDRYETIRVMYPV
jgi:hypothetical protein